MSLSRRENWKRVSSFFRVSVELRATAAYILIYVHARTLRVQARPLLVHGSSPWRSRVGERAREPRSASNRKTETIEAERRTYARVGEIPTYRDIRDHRRQHDAK